MLADAEGGGERGGGGKSDLGDGQGGVGPGRPLGVNGGPSNQSLRGKARTSRQAKPGTDGRRNITLQT